MIIGFLGDGLAHSGRETVRFSADCRKSSSTLKIDYLM